MRVQPPVPGGPGAEAGAADVAGPETEPCICKYPTVLASEEDMGWEVIEWIIRASARLFVAVLHRTLLPNELLFTGQCVKLVGME